MSLQSYVSHAMHGAVDRVRRDVIAYAICALCAIATVILGTWAAVLALIPPVGPVYAPLIVAGFYLLVILVTMLWLQMANGRKPQPAAAAAAAPATPFTVSQNAETAQKQAQFAQVAMIIEALMLGFSLSRRFDRR
jgi:hypothetical protein